MIAVVLPSSKERMRERAAKPSLLCALPVPTDILLPQVVCRDLRRSSWHAEPGEVVGEAQLAYLATGSRLRRELHLRLRGWRR